ncbi:MAG: outer membrane beta-barrel protein [Parachlamydiales bacterium]|nr:outer membrane beta-barrel protein [Parachlamydiales bacterium]
MNQKFIALIFFIFLLIPKLQATDILIEGQAGFYVPISQKFRHVYGDGGIFGGAELTMQMYRHFYFWGSSYYYHKSGSSIGFETSTEFTLVPIGLGLKFIYPVKHVDLYLGAGALPSYVKFKDKSPFVVPESKKWAVGGIVKGGAIFNFHDNLFVDLFTNYSILRTKFHNTDNIIVTRSKINLDNWAIGIGFGYRFNRYCK